MFATAEMTMVDSFSFAWDALGTGKWGMLHRDGRQLRWQAHGSPTDPAESPGCGAPFIWQCSHRKQARDKSKPQVMVVVPHLQNLQALGIQGVPLVINSHFSRDRIHIVAPNTSWHLNAGEGFHIKSKQTKISIMATAPSPKCV